MVSDRVHQCPHGTEIQNGELHQGKECIWECRFPLQFAHLLREYQQHPEAKSLAPDGTACRAETIGLLRRAYVIAGDIRYIGKETDRKWEEGDEITVLEFKNTEYGRTNKVVATEEVKKDIQKIGINKCARESGFDRKNFIRKLIRGIPVKRNSYNEFVRWLNAYIVTALQFNPKFRSFPSSNSRDANNKHL